MDVNLSFQNQPTNSNRFDSYGVVNEQPPHTVFKIRTEKFVPNSRRKQNFTECLKSNSNLLLIEQNKILPTSFDYEEMKIEKIEGNLNGESPNSKRIHEERTLAEKNDVFKTEVKDASKKEYFSYIKKEEHENNFDQRAIKTDIKNVSKENSKR